MVFGKLLFGIILGNIASALANAEIRRVHYEEKLGAIKVRYIKDIKIRYGDEVLLRLFWPCATKMETTFYPPNSSDFLLFCKETTYIILLSYEIGLVNADCSTR